ncbi:aminobutyraldehyde dehydrogenase [Conexibacter woesei]|uniref:Salicylaldehyde dehydrogenase n=1 Tax=Conexibacter woesei (strain DSM 14684 / CCUG 47730 / CIP 108061 / JCM 11494 / NBRC 100937 / ID131577) TaxID=469383 RepID=D3FCE5_CONWI|nr:aminobutyraldehyde dehydrogenase [Conexibacter woesei]ADB49418.1 Aminobutyraldehyde dehydrogenase [Conexibacter woesei DSM 14684]
MASRTILNPATGRSIAVVPEGGPADVEAAVEAARAAWPEWADSTPRERAAVLLAIADAIAAEREQLARLESANAGKPLPAARGEMDACCKVLRYFAGAARILEGKAAGEYMRGYTSMVRREPIGIVAGIAQWNYPLLMAVWKLGPALAAGNVQILKPAEGTPLSLLALADLTRDTIPAGVLNVITGDGPTVGQALVAHPAIGLVSVTGGSATGTAIARTAADTLTRVHLELGGKAPAIVLDDADLDQTVAALRVAGFENAGQNCVAACRVIATAGIYDRLLEQLVPAVASLRVGDPADGDEIELGPVISPAHQRRVLGFVERAVAASATVLTGGDRAAGPAGGAFVAPTVLAGVAQDSEIVQNEVFGPVVTVQQVDDYAQALAYANDSRYGLAASIFTENAGRALDAARRLEFGCVWVNDHLAPITPEMPHGGYKQSGYGKDLSAFSLEDYTQVKHVAIRIGG